MKFDKFSIIVIFLLIGFVVGTIYGSSLQLSATRSSAIKAGVAEYVIVDEITGKTEFRWKKVSED